MFVELQDGKCRECGGQLRIIAADDATLTVECQVCVERYDVHAAAFGDGGTHYWPAVMADRPGEGDEP